MAYENFRPVKLFQWVNNQTRLNQTNMNELRGAVQSASDALLDFNGSGIIYDIGELNAGVFGNSTKFRVGAEKKIETLNSYIFGDAYKAYTTDEGETKLVVPKVVQDYFNTTFGDGVGQKKCIIAGYSNWGVSATNLNIGSTEEHLTGHKGALAHLAYVTAQSEVNRNHLEAIDTVYGPNKITFKNTGSIIHSGSDFLEINGASGLSVRFNQVNVDSIKITPEGIVHTITSTLPSIGTNTSRFGALYVNSIDCSDRVDVGGVSSFAKLSTFNNGIEVTGALTVMGQSLLTTPNGYAKLDVGNTTESEVVIRAAGKIILADHVEFCADMVQLQNIQGSAPNSVVIKGTLDTAVANLTGESEDTILTEDNTIDTTKQITLTSLRNAILTWQSM